MAVLTSIVLILIGIEDLRTKRIPLWLLTLVILASSIYGVYQNGIAYSLIGVIPGTLLLLVSFLQPEMIGKGDGLLAFAYGILYGWRNTSIWLMYSLLLVSVVGLFEQLFFQKRKLQLPFVPFMGIVHIGMCL